MKKLILEETLKLNSDFALHPKLHSFYDLWQNNQAAFVHATSIPYVGRSHFDGQNLMESGGKVPYQEKTGWLGRGMMAANHVGEGLALALPMPLLLRGVPLNDNYYPAKGSLPSKIVLESLSSAYRENGEINLQMVMDIIQTKTSVIAGVSYHLLSSWVARVLLSMLLQMVMIEWLISCRISLHLKLEIVDRNYA